MQVASGGSVGGVRASQPQRALLVTVLRGNGIPSISVFGKQSPFVLLQLVDGDDTPVGACARTASVLKGGRAPTWSSGHTALFPTNIQSRTYYLLIEVLAEDKGAPAGRLLCGARLDASPTLLRPPSADNPSAPLLRTVELKSTSSKGKVTLAGTLDISLQCVIGPAEVARSLTLFHTAHAAISTPAPSTLALSTAESPRRGTASGVIWSRPVSPEAAPRSLQSEAGPAELVRRSSDASPRRSRSSERTPHHSLAEPPSMMTWPPPSPPEPPARLLGAYIPMPVTQIGYLFSSAHPGERLRCHNFAPYWLSGYAFDALMIGCLTVNVTFPRSMALTDTQSVVVTLLTADATIAFASMTLQSLHVESYALVRFMTSLFRTYLS